MASTKQLETIERKRKEKLEREHKIINGVDHKFCNKHHIHFPEEDIWFPTTTEYFYYNDKNKTDYLHPECKRCGVKRADIWAKEHPERTIILTKRKRTSPRKREYSRLAHGKARESGYYAEYMQRPEVKARKYGSRHRDHEITPQEWIHCKNYFKDEDGDWCCAYCGIKIQNHLIVIKGVIKNSDLHKEHKDDKSANDIRNCIPSCKDCNSNKWAFDFEEWYRKQQFFTEDRYNKIIQWCTEDYKLYIEDKPLFKIYKKKNEDNNKFHYEIWELDELMNRVRCISIANKKNDLANELKDLISNT